jgi:hypothetical protein
MLLFRARVPAEVFTQSTYVRPGAHWLIKTRSEDKLRGAVVNEPWASEGRSSRSNWKSYHGLEDGGFGDRTRTWHVLRGSLYNTIAAELVCVVTCQSSELRGWAECPCPCHAGSAGLVTKRAGMTL